MKITSVAVLGAGAVGSYVIWGLANREDIKLGVIAEGEKGKTEPSGLCDQRKGLSSGGVDTRGSRKCGFPDRFVKIRCITGSIGKHPKNSWKRYQCNEPDEWRGQRRDHRRTDWKVTHSSGCD